MEAVNLGRASVLANSYGCQIVASMAARCPNRVDSLVLVGPTTDPDRRTYWKQLLYWQVELLREPWDYIAMQVRDYATAGVRRALQTYRHMMADRIEDSLVRVQAPTLVIRGSRDPVISEAWASTAASIVPNSRFASIPGAIYPINYTAPLELARIVTPFLERADSH